MEKEYENLRDLFNDETKLDIVSEVFNDDIGFSDAYVKWLEDKVINLTKVPEGKICDEIMCPNKADSIVGIEFRYNCNEHKNK